MKTSELLRLAATPDYLDTGDQHCSMGAQEFLCHALERVSEVGGEWWQPVPDRKRALHRAKAVIKRRLGPYITSEDWQSARTVETWLEFNVPEFANMHGRARGIALQTYRKEWALHLAAEFEAKGD